jgi:predicted metal-dependent HD superfamily phosphohydrolase
VDGLRSSWHALLAPFGAGDVDIDAAWVDVARRYGEPHRRYHTLEHVGEVLAVVDRLAGDAADPAAVRLAAWLHDVVYDPSGPGSEAASARYAEERLDALGVPRRLVATVARLIESTASHRPASDDADGAVLTDADLSILGARPDRYDRYAADVRAEYVAVADDAWRTGRAAVLRDFLDRDRLYVTDTLHDELDARARANLRRELASL